jgi:hypothetical protein
VPPALQSSVAVAVGHVSACVVTRAGLIQCTGHDLIADGQLGFDELRIVR